MIAPTLPEMAAVFGTADTMTEEEARNYAGPLRVLVLCPAGRDVTENTQCTSLSSTCEGCPAMQEPRA